MAVSSRSTFYPYYIRPGWREHDRLPLYDPIELNHNGECGNLIDRMAAIFLGRPGELYKNYGYKADFTAAGNTNSPIGNGRRRGYWGSDQRSFASGTGGAIVLGSSGDSNGAMEGDTFYGQRNRSIFCKFAPARNPITHGDQLIVRCGSDIPFYLDDTGTSGRLTYFSNNGASKAYAAVSSDCYSGRFIHGLTSHGIGGSTSSNQAWCWRGDGVKSAGTATGVTNAAGSLTLCLPNGGTDVTIGHLIVMSFGSSGAPLTDHDAEPLLDIRALFKPKVQVSYFILPAQQVAAGGGVEGSLDLTQAGNTASSSAALALSGVLSKTQASDTASIAGAIDLSGTLSVSQEGDSVAATGSQAAAGSLDISQAGDSVSSAAILAIDGAVISTQEGDSASSAAALDIKSSVSVSQAGDSTFSAAKLAIDGALSATQAGDSISAVGVSTEITVGDLAITQAGNTVSAAGELDIAATLSASQAGDTASAAGEIALSASVSATQQGNTVSSASVVYLSAALSATQASNTVAAAGSDLSAIILSAERTFTLQAENRVFIPAAESRVIAA